MRCLSPESKRQAETPKSPNLIAPRVSMRMFPAFENHKNIHNWEKEKTKKKSNANESYFCKDTNN